MPPRFKVLIALLALSNIATGAFAFQSLRALDRKYSALLAGVVPALNDLQTLTARETDAMRQTNPAVIIPVGPQSIERARDAINTEQGLRRNLLHRPLLQRPCPQRDEFERAGEAFTTAARETVESAAVGSDAADLTRRRDEKLRPAFERYLAATTSYADKLQAEAFRASEELSAHTGTVARIAFAVGNWPVVVVLLLGLTSMVVLLFVARTSLFMNEERWRM